MLLNVSKVSVNRWCRGVAKSGDFVGHYLDKLDGFLIDVMDGVQDIVEPESGEIVVLLACRDGQQFSQEFPNAVKLFTHSDVNDQYRLDIACHVHSVALARVAAELRADSHEVAIIYSHHDTLLR